MTTSPQVEKALTDCFNAFDTDKSGFIDEKELQNVITTYVKHKDCPASYKATYSDPAKVKAACEDFIKEVDTSGDKKISLKEFLAFFAKK
jgi:Ca2+-binding EF-hand superfamily protein